MTRRDVLIGILLGMGMACVVFGPSWWQGGFVGDPGIDVWSHVWGMAWFAEALTDGRLPWEVQGLRHPEGGVLWYIDLIGATLATPAMALGAHVFGYNAVLWVQVVLASVGGRAWEQARGGPGLYAPLALACTPFMVCTWSNGVVEAGWVGLVALAAAAAERESRWAGPWLGACFVATPYLGISASVLVGVSLALRGRWRLLAWTWGVGAVVALPVAWGLAQAFEDPRTLAIKPPPGPRWPTWRINGVDPRALVVPGDFWSVRIEGDGAPPFRRTPYLGWVTLVAAGVAWGRRRAHALWGVPVVVGVVLALGPVLFWSGDFARWPATAEPIWLPFGWIWSLTGVGMDHPLRFVVMAQVALVGVAAVACRGRPRWSFALGVLTVVESLAVAPTVWPLPTSPAELPSVYAELPPDGLGVIDLPADRGGTMETSRYLYWHALHGRPVPYGNKVSGSLLRLDNDALRRWTTRGKPLRADERDLQQLREWGYGYVVVHAPLCGTGCASLVERVTVQLGEPRRGAEAWWWPLGTSSGSARSD